MLKGALFVKNRIEYLISSANKLLVRVQKPNCGLAGKMVRIDSVGNIEFCKRSDIQPGNLFDDSKMRFDRRINNAMNTIRKNNMSACSIDCPHLIK